MKPDEIQVNFFQLMSDIEFLNSKASITEILCFT